MFLLVYLHFTAKKIKSERLRNFPKVILLNWWGEWNSGLFMSPIFIVHFIYVSLRYFASFSFSLLFLNLFLKFLGLFILFLIYRLTSASWTLTTTSLSCQRTCLSFPISWSLSKKCLRFSWHLAFPLKGTFIAARVLPSWRGSEPLSLSLTRGMGTLLAPLCIPMNSSRRMKLSHGCKPWSRGLGWAWRR